MIFAFAITIELSEVIHDLAKSFLSFAHSFTFVMVPHFPVGLSIKLKPRFHPQ